MSRAIIIGIYYIILVIAIIISSVFSYFGFLPSIDNVALTLAFVAIIALGLFAAGTLVQIGRDRKSLKEQLLALLLFFVFAIFSTSSNFTYLYTNMRSVTERQDAINEERGKFETVVTELRTVVALRDGNTRSTLINVANWYGETVNKNLNIRIEQLNEVPEFVNFVDSVNELNIELDNLLTQVNDPGRPGCGQRCRDHYNSINKIVTDFSGTAPTNLVVPRDQIKFQAFFEQYKEAVWQSICGANNELVTLYILSKGTSPSDFCSIGGRTTRRDVIDLTSKKIDPSIAGVEAYLKNLNSKVLSINSVIGNVKSQEGIPLRIPNIPSNLEKAAERYSKRFKTAETPENVSYELARKNSKLLAELELALVEIDVNQPLMFDDKNCSNEFVIKNPRQCLITMDKRLSYLRNEFISLYPPDDEPIALRETEINIENGQIGTIKDTLYNGLIELPSIQTTIFSFFVGVMIDVLPLIFAFVAFHGYQRRNNKDDLWEIKA